MNEIAERYMALWNEVNDDARRKAVDEMFTPDAVYLMFNNDPFVGRDAIFKHVTVAHRIYIPFGFTFKSSYNASGHHNVVRFDWVMVSTDTGEAEMTGNDMLVLDDEGRIQADYQFHDKLSTSIRYDQLPSLEEMYGDVLSPADIERYRAAFAHVGNVPEE
jgi:hypothetical protein